jgi:hypothetical protein
MENLNIFGGRCEVISNSLPNTLEMKCNKSIQHWKPGISAANQKKKT